MVNQPQTRASLIIQLQGHRCERAWCEFVSAYEPFLNRLVARQGVPARHVPDVTQQVLAAVAQSVDRWSDDGDEASFRRWLCRVARNVVIKFMSRERRQVGGEGGSDLIDLLRDIPDQVAAESIDAFEYELLLWAAGQVRSQFKASSWTAFWQTLVEGREVAQVAAELNLSPGSIYMSRSRIMRSIREKVDEVMGP